jgi:hypothetical protein
MESSTYTQTLVGAFHTPRLVENQSELSLPMEETGFQEGAGSGYLDEVLAGAGAPAQYQSFRPTEVASFTYTDPPLALCRACGLSDRPESLGQLKILFWLDAVRESFGVCTLETGSVATHTRVATLMAGIRPPCQLAVSADGSLVYFLQLSGCPSGVHEQVTPRIHLLPR